MINKQIAYSVLRHILTMVGTILAVKGIAIDAATMDAVAQLVIGLVFAGGATIAGSLNKTKPIDVLEQDPIDVESTKQAPKGFYFGEGSLAKFKGVNKDLVSVMKIAIVNSPYDFKITEGLRSAERQRELLNSNKSWVKRSKHQDGLALDIMCYDENGQGSWDIKYYQAVAEHILDVARKEGVSITWGGSWKQVDGVHFEIEVGD